MQEADSFQLPASLSQGITFNGLPLLVATSPVSYWEPPAAAFAAMRTSALCAEKHGRTPSQLSLTKI